MLREFFHLTVGRRPDKTEWFCFAVACGTSMCGFTAYRQKSVKI
ncbi:MAG: hypothetical protein ACI4XE_03750 [Acutalibacteraceae bacterium]